MQFFQIVLAGFESIDYDTPGYGGDKDENGIPKLKKPTLDPSKNSISHLPILSTTHLLFLAGADSAPIKLYRIHAEKTGNR